MEVDYQWLETMKTVHLPAQSIEIQHPDDWYIGYSGYLVSLVPKDQQASLYPNMSFIIYTSDSSVGQSTLGQLIADSAAEHLQEITHVTDANTIQSVSINGHDGAHVFEQTTSGRISYHVAIRVDKDVVAIISGSGYESKIDEIKNVGNAIALSVELIE